jgi:5-methylcytosine-specific restriction endonuclease McrA
MKVCSCGEPTTGGPQSKYCDPCRAVATRATQRASEARKREKRSALRKAARATLLCQCGKLVVGKSPAKFCAECKKASLYASQKAFMERNRERFAEAIRQRGRRNGHRRRARLKDARSPGVTTEQWRAICDAHGFRCAYCSVEDKLTVDHVVPISRGGLDAPDNVVPACKSCNSSKGAKLLTEWRRQSAA